MIKKLKALLAGLALVAVSATSSAAIWSQTIDLNPDKYIGAPFSWTHDLTTVGFQPGQGLITSFSLSLTIKDDNDSWWEIFEIAKVDLPGFLADETWAWPIGTNSAGPDLAGLISLNTSGLLSVSLSATLGDFYLDKSVLNASGVGHNVPEPGALALVGLGLAGLAFTRRRRQKE